MEDHSPLLRRLPRIDDLMNHPRLRPLLDKAPKALALRVVREVVEEVRQAILGESKTPPDTDPDTIAARAAERLQDNQAPSLRRVINATGVILHTGLGRAPLPKAAQAALKDVTDGFSNVQADLETGERIQRETHVRDLLQELTGAESALIVNNNAAATVLALSALAKGKEVILSRGEMVEIGGSFRIPDIMNLAGAKLVEVGCTNRTHVRDYEDGINDETGLLLSIHQSNYRIEGFASQVDIADMVPIARKAGIPCIHDLGSGALVDLSDYGLPHEPTVTESVRAGADAVLFSGDKLIGGPQCGIIVGKDACLQKMRKNPYYRAFRVDKLTLAALEATLRLFQEPDTLKENHRLYSILLRSQEDIHAEACAIRDGLNARCGGAVEATIEESESRIGGGSLAGFSLPTTIVATQFADLPPDEVARQLRLSEPPIFTRVQKDAVLMDPRTLFPGDGDTLVRIMANISRPKEEA
jgi:L-seryl-tRNA(Ser) seleniumtransferase